MAGRRSSAATHTLVCAPTGSGKTLTAFLASIDRLCTTEPADPKRRTRVLYISPLRALAFDVEKNLRAPLMGIGLAAERLGVPFRQPTVAMRTGDTSSQDRQALIRHPVDLLITTPESLYLMLTSSAADTLVNVDTVIIDEIHAMATTKRGAHLMLSLERLEAITARPPQRIGLSATQRPLEEVAHFLGGHGADGRPAPGHHRRRRHPQAAGGRRRRAGRGHGQHLGERVPGGARPGAGPPHARSSSATPAARPSAWPPTSTSSPAKSWSRRTTARWPASSGSSSKTS